MKLCLYKVFKFCLIEEEKNMKSQICSILTNFVKYFKFLTEVKILCQIVYLANYSLAILKFKRHVL